MMSHSAHIAVEEIRLWSVELRTRMPFRYGIATMTTLPHVFARVRLNIDGVSTVGTTSENLPPKWFTKDPDASVDAEIEEMLTVIRAARSHAEDLEGNSVFSLWEQLYTRQRLWGEARKLPPLLVHLGTALMEKAFIDAACKAWLMPFGEALRADRFAIDLGFFHLEMKGRQVAEFLPEKPLASVYARHTVGLGDPLRRADVIPGERIDDGLPQALQDCIAFYGLKHFKIKVTGDIGDDTPRLRSLAEVLSDACAGEFAVSLDGNEQFRDLKSFVEYWTQLASDRMLEPILRRTLFLEQPFHRNVALRSGMDGLGRLLPDLPPLIIDESDGDIGSLARALELGYAGTSHKNCKGVFKGIANACLLRYRKRQSVETGNGYLLSGEDLANVGPIALTQDLAVQAALGVTSVERNGHHYFSGLSIFPASIWQPITAFHEDLYVMSGHGWPRVDIRSGSISLGSVNAAPFGLGYEVDLSECDPLP